MYPGWLLDDNDTCSLFQVFYDDGDEETLNLVKEKWKVIDADSDADEVGVWLVSFVPNFLYLN